jgi:hypothetical protein
MVATCCRRHVDDVLVPKLAGMLYNDRYLRWRVITCLDDFDVRRMPLDASAYSDMRSISAKLR